jgi:hypothetical protein
MLVRAAAKFARGPRAIWQRPRMLHQRRDLLTGEQLACAGDPREPAPAPSWMTLHQRSTSGGLTARSEIRMGGGLLEADGGVRRSRNRDTRRIRRRNLVPSGPVPTGHATAECGGQTEDQDDRTKHATGILCELLRLLVGLAAGTRGSAAVDTSANALRTSSGRALFARRAALIPSRAFTSGTRGCRPIQRGRAELLRHPSPGTRSGSRGSRM